MGEEAKLLKALSENVGNIMQGRACAQAGAICVRGEAAGREVLLITSRDTGRWVIPKGTIEKKEDARQAAAREAREEAGVSGAMSKKPFGYYTYVKSAENKPCIVTVFLLQAKEVRERFPEARVRQHEWVSPIEASNRVDEPELKGLLIKLAA